MTYATQEEFQNRFETRDREFRLRALEQRMGEGFTSATLEQQQEWLATAETIYRGLREIEKLTSDEPVQIHQFDQGKFLEAAFVADLLRLRTPMDGDVPPIRLRDLIAGSA